MPEWQMEMERMSGKKFVYRITDQDCRNMWESNYKDALKTQKSLYAEGAEMVEIVKEYL